MVLATVAFLVHHYGPWRGRVRLSRWAGLVLFGLPSRLITPEAMALPRLLPAALFLAIVFVVILPVVVLAARQPRYWESYPDDRRERWDLRAELGNAASWTAYLPGRNELDVRACLALFDIVSASPRGDASRYGDGAVGRRDMLSLGV